MAAKRALWENNGRGFWPLVLGLFFLMLLPQHASYALNSVPQSTQTPKSDIQQNPNTEAIKPVIIATSFHGPYILVWRAILADAGIPFKNIDVLQGRRRRMFVEGFLTLDCCFSPEWRNRLEEQKTQLFTDSIVTTEIRYIFKKGHVVAIQSPADLNALRIARVRGFNYTLEDYFTHSIPAQSIGDALRLVEVGRADLTQASRIQFEFEMARSNRDLEIGGVANYVNLHGRVHISRAELLPRLNAAIVRMKKDGRIQKILKDALSK